MIVLTETKKEPLLEIDVVHVQTLKLSLLWKGSVVSLNRVLEYATRRIKQECLAPENMILFVRGFGMGIE